MQLSVEGGAVSYTQAKDAASRGHLRGVNSNVAVLTTGRGGGTQRGSDVLHYSLSAVHRVQRFRSYPSPASARRTSSFTSGVTIISHHVQASFSSFHTIPFRSFKIRHALPPRPYIINQERREQELHTSPRRAQSSVQKYRSSTHSHT